VNVPRNTGLAVDSVVVQGVGHGPDGCAAIDRDQANFLRGHLDLSVASTVVLHEKRLRQSRVS